MFTLLLSASLQWCVSSLITLQRTREKLDEQFSDNMLLFKDFVRLFNISKEEISLIAESWEEGY